MHSKYWTLLIGSLLTRVCSIVADEGPYNSSAIFEESNLTLSCKDHIGSTIAIDLNETFIEHKSLKVESCCKIYADNFNESHLTELLTYNGSVECTVTPSVYSNACCFNSWNNEVVVYWCVKPGTWTARSDTKTTETGLEVTRTAEVVSTEASNRDDGTATDTQAIVAGTVGCGSLVVMTLVVIAFLYYRRKKRQKPPPGHPEFKPSQSREGDSRYVEFPLKPQTVNGPNTVKESESKVTALGDDVAVVYHNSGKCGDAPSGTQQMASQGESDVDDDDMILTENDLYETRDYEGGSETADPATAAAAEEDEADNDMILTDNDLYEAS